MPTYKNLSGESGVIRYTTNARGINVFFSGGVYLYTNSIPGRSHVTRMKRLARNGQGLNTYINKHVHFKYLLKSF